MSYRMTEPPGNDSVESLRIWLIDNLRRIESVLNTHENIQFKRWGKLPQRVEAGQVYYLLSDVIPGDAEGLYYVTTALDFVRVTP